MTRETNRDSLEAMNDDLHFEETFEAFEQDNFENDHPPYDKKERLSIRIFWDFLNQNGYLKEEAPKRHGALANQPPKK